MELKVWVEGIQRIVCGVSEKTTCQDVVYALAHATGKTGRFTLIERWRNNERLLAPQDHPLKVLSKWGEYSNDVQFILQRSPLDNNKAPSSPPQQRSKTLEGAVQPSQVKKSHTFSGQLHPQAPNPSPIWKSPPPSGAPVFNSISTTNLSTVKSPPVSGEPARFSPDSGRGSDPTGSDTSNFSDQEKTLALSRSSHPPIGIEGQKPQLQGILPFKVSSHTGHLSSEKKYQLQGVLPSGYLPSGYLPKGYPDCHYKVGRTDGRFHSQSPDRGQYPDGYGYTKPRSESNPPPAYRPPPHPGQGSHAARNSSPADPPPYRNPPPPPGSSSRHQAPMPTSPTANPLLQHLATTSPGTNLWGQPLLGPSWDKQVEIQQAWRYGVPGGVPLSLGGGVILQPSPKMGRNMPHSPTPPKSHQFVRPHYSPPPHHREARGHPRGPSPGRNLPNKVNNPARPPIIEKYPTRGHSIHSNTERAIERGLVPTTEYVDGWSVPPPHSVDSCKNQRLKTSKNLSMQQDGSLPTTDNYVDLFNLVSAQQTRIQSQHAEIKHADSELNYFVLPGNNSSSGNVPQSPWSPGRPGAGGQRPEPPPSQLDAVVTEVKRLEDVAVKNDRELHNFKDLVPGFSGEDGAEIRTELDQLNNRLEITDMELQKTNLTLRRLGDDLKSFSQEQSRQEEAELKQEVDRIQAEIKHLKKSSEEGVNISDKLHQEVQDIENQISARKSEVEKLIQDMMSANLKSLTYEKQGENKHFLEGPSKPGTTRKMLGSPRELENAVPTSKNPHGVWV